MKTKTLLCPAIVARASLRRARLSDDPSHSQAQRRTLTGLSYCPWDIHRYKRLTAAPDLTWVGRCCFVVAPCFEGVLTPEDFVNQDINTHLVKFSNTSLICVGADAVKYSHLMYSYDAPIGEVEARPNPVSAIAYRCATPTFCGLWNPMILLKPDKERLQGWTARGLMRYTNALTSRDSSRRMHQAVFDKDNRDGRLNAPSLGTACPTSNSTGPPSQQAPT